MFLSANGADEPGLQVSLRRQVHNREDSRQHEASVPGLQVLPVHQSRHEDGV